MRRIEFRNGGVSFSLLAAPEGLREDPDHVASVLAERRGADKPGQAQMHLHRPRKNRYVKRSLRGWKRRK